MTEPTDSCSFCGKSAKEAVQMFRPEIDSGQSTIAICEDCVLTCAKAVDVEQRLSERPQSKPPDDGEPDSSRGEDAEAWLPFAMGSLALEWRAETAVVVRVRRSDNRECAVAEQFPYDTEPSIDDAESVAEDHWTKLHG